MMAILLGICVAGGVIFFAMWDYWISAPPPVVALMEGEGPKIIQVEETGVEIPVSLSFIEASDFITLAFNALPGEEGNNPTITANVGDKIIFDVINDGVSFHSFGVTANEEGTGGIYPGSEIGTPALPLNRGEGGQSEFIPPEDGIYYYICTVAGHRAQGMVGMIVVGDVEIPDEQEPEPAAADEPPKEVVQIEYEGTIFIPEGTSVPGCEQTASCYMPSDVSVQAGETVQWYNEDTVAHTVTSGTPAGGPDGIFDTGIFISEGTFEHTFDTAGEYPYYCLVHPWMTGMITVE